ncbi:SURF1-like protein [Polymorphobacter glacialis]|uniref:SURF1-like protein n=1 Tax=Sandarakinorhabdus glacialis TaxID=1614636 RepID=A0A916ZVK0_9SPHN|nr:SURF1 family cytochrome oxidase biogenesis protein [Polymorphobacter glacialis]GGE16070.1 SURF1-like protein [Polymorphobacter glacialis]
MKRGFIFPTLLTAVMLAVLIGLGTWQLQRRIWKADLIAQLEAAQRLPLLTPADYFRAMTGEISVQYRRAELPCTPGKVLPYDLKGGSSAKDVSGYLVLVSCGPAGKSPDIVAVAGWTRRPDAAQVPIDVDTTFTGLIIERPYGDAPGRPQFMLIPDTAVPPLTPSRLPSPADLPDNHLSYAGQWFGLAIVLAVIYGIWLRRRLRWETVAAAPSAS